jgi:hypothetical protein
MGDMSMYYMMRERQREMLEQADNERQARAMIRASRPQTNRPLAWVGRRLAHFGNQLVQISGETPERQMEIA